MKQFITFLYKNATLTFVYSPQSNDPELIDFQQQNSGFSVFVFHTNIDSESFNDQDAKRAIAKELWKELGNTPTDDDGADGNIDEDFLHFPKGEPVYDIWHWFEETFDVCIAADLMGV
jgi:hypothetical protein